MIMKSHVKQNFLIFQLSTGAHSQYFDLLNIFAYGTFSDYKGKVIYTNTQRCTDILMEGAVMVMDLQLPVPVQLVPITNKVVS